MAQGGVRVLAATAVAALAVGCTSPKPPPPTPPAPAPFIAPPPAAAPPAQAAPPPRPADSCGAVDLQYLIGKPRTEIPIPLYPNRRRVVCSTCPMTQDYVSTRQTIIYDAGSGLVSSVKCG